jgi:hypothetical protein
MTVELAIECSDDAMIMYESLGIFVSEVLSGRLGISMTGLALIIDIDKPERRRYLISLAGGVLTHILGKIETEIAEDRRITDE